MREDDAAYFYRRAEAELEQAQRASTPEAVHAHFMLATAYLDRVGDAEAVPEPDHA